MQPNIYPSESGVYASLADIGGVEPKLFQYTFVRVSADATLAGYFTDIYGNQIGNSFTGTISTTQKTFRDLYGQAIPTNAVGFRGRLTVGSVYYRLEEHTSELQSHSFISYAVFCLKKT